jgi:hypothetical protein
LKTLDREFKTATRSLDQLKERVNTFEEQRNKLDRDADELQQKSDDVSLYSLISMPPTLPPCSWKGKLGAWMWILRRRNKSWISSILSVRGSCTFRIGVYHSHWPYFPDSQLEQELNEKLGEIYHQLLQASVDRQESEKEARLKETLTNLSRIFPGINLFFRSVFLD